MTCEIVRDLIHPYLDGELDLVRSLEVEEHIRGCEDCTREQETIRELHTAISDCATYYQASANLGTRIRAAAGDARPAAYNRDHPFGLPHYGWGLIASAATIVLLVVFAKSMLSQPSVADTTAQEVVADHVRSLMVNHLTDVISSSQHTVKPWFDGKLDFAPQVVDLDAKNFTLVGGRLDYLKDRAVAALVYRRRLHVINLFIWPTGKGDNKSPVAQTDQGYNVVHWTKNGMTYWAVSNLNMAELQEFAGDFSNPAAASPK